MYAAKWCMTLMLKVCSPHLHAYDCGDVAKRRGGESKEAKGKESKGKQQESERHTSKCGV
jgi:hypothetical protein